MGNQGFFHCSKASKGFKLGLGQGQKGSSDTNNHKLNTNHQGLHKGHQGLNSWHQWPYTVGINDKLIKNLPLCHWWQHHKSSSEQDPLSTKLLSPFGINGKGTILWPYCSPLGHAPPVINFSSFSTFLPLWINDNKNFFWHYFFPYHWCLFDGLVFCHTDTSGTNYYTILKFDNQVHISFYKCVSVWIICEKLCIERAGH